MDARADAPEPDELLAQLGWVRALAGRLVSDPDVTDDVLQQVCLLALQRVPSEARTGLRLRAWLVNVTRRLAQHSHRSTVRRLRREQAAARAEALPSTVDAVVHREALQGLVSAVTALQEPYYSVVVARYFEGRSVADIAALNGASSEAVRQQLARARQQLRARLRALLADDERGWFRAILPLAPAGASLGPAGTPALGHVGGLLVAKTVGTSVAKIVIGLIVLTSLSVGTWYAFREDREASRTVAIRAAPAVVPGYAEPEASEPAAAIPLLGDAGAVDATTSTSLLPGRLVVGVVWATDRSPAAGVGVFAQFWNAPDPLFSGLREGLTDAAGRWEVLDAPTGHASIYLDRANGDNVQVSPGETTELLLEIPAGVLVRGLVVDTADRAVTGADVWMQTGQAGKGFVVAHTAADGRFTLRDVDQHRKIGALTAGHVPSPLVTITDDDSHTCDVTLRVGAAGSHLSGRVLDTAGAPVPGALVLIGPEEGWQPPEVGNRVLVDGQPPRRAITDAAGAFAVRDMPIGKAPVAARAPGYSLWTGVAVLHEGDNQPLEVVLPASAMLSGVVTDAGGRPLAGATIGTQTWGEMDWVSTESAADGRFELKDLPLGYLKLKASVSGLGKDATDLNVAAGARLQWNPRLTPGLQIVGRVVDANGVPVAGHHVDGDAHVPGQTTWVQGDTDAQGRFVLNNCADAEHLLTVRTPDWMTVLASKEHVRPGPDEVVLEVADARRSTFFVGRVLDARGHVPELATVVATDPDTGNGEPKTIQADTGDFRLGPLLPGDWDLYVLVNGHPQRKCGRFTLAADETRDVGIITLSDPGRVRLHVVLPEGVTADRVFATIVSPERGTEGILRREDDALPVWLSDPLDPGDYDIFVATPSIRADRSNILPTSTRVHVEASEEAQVEVVAEHGVVQHIELTTSRAEPPPVSIQILDPSGTEVQGKEAKWQPARTGTTQRLGDAFLIARPGPYTLRIECEGQVLSQQSIALPAGVNAAPDVRLVVP